jgi:hypothetical protein
MSPLVTLETLCAVIGAAEGLPVAIRAIGALIERGKQQCHEFLPAEIAALRADDDALCRALDAAIEGGGGGPKATR